MGRGPRKDEEAAERIYQYYGIADGYDAITPPGLLPKQTAEADEGPLAAQVHKRLTQLRKKGGTASAGEREREALIAARIPLIQIGDKWKIDTDSAVKNSDRRAADNVRAYYGLAPGATAIGTPGQIPSRTLSEGATEFEIFMQDRLNNLVDTPTRNHAAGPEEAAALRDARLNVVSIPGGKKRYMLVQSTGASEAASSQVMVAAPFLPESPGRTEALPEDPSHAQYPQSPGSYDEFFDWNSYYQDVGSRHAVTAAASPEDPGGSFDHSATYLPQEDDLSAEYTSLGQVDWHSAESFLPDPDPGDSYAYPAESAVPQEMNATPSTDFAMLDASLIDWEPHGQDLRSQTGYDFDGHVYPQNPASPYLSHIHGHYDAGAAAPSSYAPEQSSGATPPQQWGQPSRRSPGR